MPPYDIRHHISLKEKAYLKSMNECPPQKKHIEEREGGGEIQISG